MKNRAFVLDINDRVVKSFDASMNGAISEEYAEQLARSCHRSGVTITWTILRTERSVGKIEHYGRFLGTVLVVSSDLLKRAPDMSALLVPSDKY